MWALKILGGVLAVFGGLFLKSTYEAFARDSSNYLPFLGAFVLAVVGISIPHLVDRRKATLLQKAACREYVKKALVRLGEFFRGAGNKHVRTNIMLIEGDNTKVDSDSAFNMQNDSDKELELPKVVGVCGMALRTKSWALGDLRLLSQAGGPDWSLPADKQAFVRTTLKTILSVCIFDPDAVAEGDQKPPVIGTLQVDSDQPFEDVFPDVDAARQVSTSMADCVAILLRTGGLA